MSKSNQECRLAKLHHRHFDFICPPLFSKRIQTMQQFLHSILYVLLFTVAFSLKQSGKYSSVSDKIPRKPGQILILAVLLYILQKIVQPYLYCNLLF